MTQTNTTDTGAELATLDANMAALADKLDRIQACALAVSEGDNNFTRVFRQAQCVQLFRETLTDEVMRPVMALQNSALGFRTDKDPQGYPVNVVKDAIIEAGMRGLMPVGNQFNIISGRMYVTKEGFLYLLGNIPGLRYTIDYDVPRMAQGGAIVHTTTRWCVNANEYDHQHERDVCIRVNAGMGADAILGKAARKAMAWLYGEVTRTYLEDADAGDLGEPMSAGRVPSMRNVTAAAAPAAHATTAKQTAPAAAMPAPAAEAPVPQPTATRSRASKAAATAPATRAAAPANGELLGMPEQPATYGMGE